MKNMVSMKIAFPFALACLLAILYLSTGPVFAQDRNNAINTQGLVTVCLAEMVAVENGESIFDEMFCHGYLQAVHDSFYDGLEGAMPRKICVPDGVTRKMLAHLFTSTALAIIKNDPEMADSHASSTAYAVFTSAYPCPE